MDTRGITMFDVWHTIYTAVACFWPFKYIIQQLFSCIVFIWRECLNFLLKNHARIIELCISIRRKYNRSVITATVVPTLPMVYPTFKYNLCFWKLICCNKVCNYQSNYKKLHWKIYPAVSLTEHTVYRRVPSKRTWARVHVEFKFWRKAHFKVLMLLFYWLHHNYKMLFN